MMVSIFKKVLVIMVFSFIAMSFVSLPLYAQDPRDTAMKKVLSGKKLPAEAYRQELEAVVEEETPVEAERPFGFETYARFMPAAKAHAISGKVSLIDSQAEFNYDFKAFGKIPIEVALISGYVGINNSTGVKLPATLTGLAFDAEMTLPFFWLNKTYIRFGVTPSFYGEDWQVRSGSFRMPSRTFLIYQPNNKLTLIGGIGIYPDFKNKAWPILGFIYNYNDKLSFNIVPDRYNVNYAVNKKVDVFIEVHVTSSEFVVKKDGIKNAILKYNQNQLGTGLRYKFNKYIESSFSVGGVFKRSLKYRDSLGKVALRDGVYTELRCSISM